MNRQAILDRLNAEAPPLREKYGVQSLAVFDSIARGDDHDGSDVDVLVTFTGPATFRGFMGLKLELEDLLGRPVDLGTPTPSGPRSGPMSREICSMSRDWRLGLGDLAICCEKITTFVGASSREEFLANVLMYDAVLRKLEILGEAAKHVPFRGQGPDARGGLA